jgi:uncharacterized protein with ParB-like and HNH nuclease domain
MLRSYDSRTIHYIYQELNRTIYLPDIQRDFVWEPDRIARLFDSLMGDYPIGSFLFGKVREENKDKWRFYKFIKHFDKEDPRNEEADTKWLRKDIYLVLDGQQRLTALYIGLGGSYRYHYYKWRKGILCLNLLKEPKENEDDPEELLYQFEFKELNEITNSATELWYEVGRILEFDDPEEAINALDAEISHLEQRSKKNARKLISRLHSRIFNTPIINYYEESSQEPDKVVQVFVRANTEGVHLGYSDILMSLATAKWKTIRAKEELNNFVKSLNSIGSGYSFAKDFILKGCLYLTDDLPIQYRVKNFTPINLYKIEDNWEEIKYGLENVVRLISRFGFQNKNITSQNALLPIAYYITKLSKKNYIYSTEQNDVLDQVHIKKWLIMALLLNAFSSSSDSKLNLLRNELKNSISHRFDSDIMLRKLEINTSLSDVQIDNFLDYKYGQKHTYLILSLLYPDRDWKDITYHEDHIFPQSTFTNTNLRSKGYNQTIIDIYMSSYNTLCNLQLLTESENLEKHSKDFDQWIVTRDPNFKQRHLIPALSSYHMDDFEQFISERQKLIRSKLGSI